MSRKNSRSDSIEFFIAKSRTSSCEYRKSTTSVSSRSMSIGSIESICLEDDTSNTSNKNINDNTIENTNIVVMLNGTKTRKRDLYLNDEMKISLMEPSPTPSSYLKRMMSTFQSTKK